MKNSRGGESADVVVIVGWLNLLTAGGYVWVAASGTTMSKRDK